MMQFLNGDILLAEAESLVNTLNCVGLKWAVADLNGTD